jgi:hypothetical protein
MTAAQKLLLVNCRIASNPCSRINRSAYRAFSVQPPLGDPLELLRRAAERKMLCDSQGHRRPGVNWMFQLAVTQSFTDVPTLKTVTFQQVSSLGLDFIMKRPDVDKTSTVGVLSEMPQISMLYLSGDYRAGDTVEQWRGEGTVYEIDLKDIISFAPSHSLVLMLASKRATSQLRKLEGVVAPSSEPLETEVHRSRIEKHSKFVELVQQTHRELENGNISREEIEDAICAFRLVPDRLERMIGGPDMVTWDRWEWKKQTDDKGFTSWDVRHLLPF